MYDKVREALAADGWSVQDVLDDRRMFMADKVMASGGAFGRKGVMLQVCERGRYLERVDGWGKVEKDVDLRNYDNPGEAIAEVLKGM